MNKWLRALLPVAALAAGLTGCGGDGTGSGDRAPVDLETLDPSGQEVVFWYQHTRQREDALKAMIEQFNAGNEHGITVRGEYAGDYGAIYNKMRVGLQGGVLPELVVAYQNQALEYFRAGGILDLTAYIESPRWGLSAAQRADFVQAFMRQDRLPSGAQTGLPPNRSIEVLYHNVDWLEELGADGPPRSWEEFARLCRAARDNPFSANENPSRSLGFVLDPDASRLASMVFSRGGSFLDEAGDRYLFDTPQARASLALMQELAAEGAVELMGEDDGDAQAFYVGQALFILASTSGLPYTTAGVEDGSAFAWSVAPPPHSTEEPVVNFYGASISLGRTEPARQLAAWLFLKWFTEPPQQARWVKASNYFPARKSTRDLLSDYLEANPRYARAFELLEYGHPEPALAGYQAVRREVAKTVVRIMQGAAVQPALAELERAANATLAEQGG